MEKRNIVLITFDSLRADHCSFMGYHRKTTPNMDRMARKGIVFENAISPGPRTIPAMPQIFTGKLMNFVSTDKFFGERDNVRRHLKINKTIPQILKSFGYVTGAFCPNAYTSRYFNFDKGFDFFQDFFFSKKSHTKIFEKMISGNKIYEYIRNLRNLILKQEAFRSWESYYNDIIGWVEKLNKPFFLWVFLLDTHLPWMVPRKYRRWCKMYDILLYNWKMFRLLGKYVSDFSEKDREKLIGLYDNSIYYSDDFVSRLLKDLSDFDPIFVIHADHGEEFGEHCYFGHYYPHMYNENIHVPFMIYNTDEKVRISKAISLLKLPLILSELTSGSLTIDSLLSGYTITKDYNYTSNRLVMSVILDDWKYIIGHNSNPELYNLKRDPHELENLANKYPEIENELKKIIKRYAKKEVETNKIYTICLRKRMSL